MMSISKAIPVLFAIVTAVNSHEAAALMISERHFSITGALKRIGLMETTQQRLDRQAQEREAECNRQINSIKLFAKNIERLMETIREVTDIMSAGPGAVKLEMGWVLSYNKNFLMLAYRQMKFRLEYISKSLAQLSIHLLSESDKEYFYNLRRVLANNFFELSKIRKTELSSFIDENYKSLISRHILQVISDMYVIIGDNSSDMSALYMHEVKKGDISEIDLSWVLYACGSRRDFISVPEETSLELYKQ